MKTPKKRICEKCDGAHSASRCPHFRKERSKHPDAAIATKSSAKERPWHRRRVPLERAKVLRVPGDGNCMFHSVAAFQPRWDATFLRVCVAYAIEHRCDRISSNGTNLEQWIAWEHQESVRTYARRMKRSSAWGGAIELLVLNFILKRPITVWTVDSARGQYEEIASFSEYAKENSINLLYSGSSHYDALFFHAPGDNLRLACTS